MDRELVKEAALSLGYGCLKPEQEKAVMAFIRGEDLFVSLPTGYGKSVCYAILPRVFDHCLVKKSGERALLLKVTRGGPYSQFRTAMH